MPVTPACFRPLEGRIARLEHSSTVLRDNPWGDPARRTLYAYLPPGYDDDDRRYPTLWDLAGYTGAGPAHIGWRAFDESVVQRVDRLIASGAMAPAIVLFPDCFTTLGGNQYINSTALGAYADYLIDELVPFVDGELRTLAAAEHRGVFGKSSGGYGALVHGMRYPHVWGAVADHSGDAQFDVVYRSDFPDTIATLSKHDRDVRAFIEHFWQVHKPSGTDIHALMIICMAATYDPDPEAELGFRLPFDLYTGELDAERWQRWLAHDPIYLVRDYAGNLARLKALFIDCGWRDQYHIHLGNRILARELTRAGVEHVYEEFDDDHSGIDYRLERSLPYLAAALTANAHG